VAKAGTSVGLPYYHFGSKKQIFLTLWSEYQSSQETRTRQAVAAARGSGAAGKDLLLAGTCAYMWGAWEARDIVPMLHSMDAPSGFDAAIRDADRRWERQNQALLSEYDSHLVPGATLMFAGALRAVCLRLPRCRNRAEASEVIEQALVLFTGLLGSLAT
jgi:AcrR family transcriptional regulator